MKQNGVFCLQDPRSFWRNGPLVRPIWPLVTRHANCAQKETFQVPTDLSSCIFSIGIILTSKPKCDFSVKSVYVVCSHEELVVSLL